VAQLPALLSSDLGPWPTLRAPGPGQISPGSLCNPAPRRVSVEIAPGFYCWYFHVRKTRLQGERQDAVGNSGAKCRL